MNREYSSHDYYTWEPYFGEYRKNVVFTGVYPQGQDREAADYLEGAWRVAGVDMWDQEPYALIQEYGKDILLIHGSRDSIIRLNLSSISTALFLRSRSMTSGCR